MSKERTYHDERAEQSVLGAVLIDPTIAGWLDISTRDFFNPRNRFTWDAICALQSEGEAVDEVTIATHLLEQGRLNAVGGHAYLGQLAIACATPSHAEHYAKAVKGWAINRKLLGVGDHLRAQLDAGTVGEELLDEATAYLGRIERPRGDMPTLGDGVRAEQQAIRDYDPATDRECLPTGIVELDDLITGIPVGVTSVIGARPSEGKSSLALAIARNIARRGPTLILTAEDRVRTMAQRVIADLANLAVNRVRAREFTQLGDQTRVLDAADDWMDHVYIEHVHGWPMAKVARTIRAYSRLKGITLACYDYLQKCPKPRGLKPNNAVEENLNTWDDTVGELDIGGLMLSQLSRECEKEGRRPKRTDLRDSGTIEAVAKLIMLLHPGQHGLEVIVAKQHQGARQEYCEINFEREFCRIA